MAAITFEVRGKKNPSSIYLRFRDSGKNHYKKSGKLIDPKDWNHDKKLPYGRSPNLKNLGTDLKEMANEIIKAYNQTPSHQINPDWLQKEIDRINGNYSAEESHSELLTEAIQFVIDTANIRENSKGGIGLSISRINSYKNLLKIVKTYQGKKQLKVQDVDIKFGKDFMNWMLNKRNYSEGYARKKIDDLKTVCADAEINGLMVSPQLRKVKGGKTKNENIIYLSPQELNQIRQTTLTTESIKNARKWLLLGCNIGQRGGDLLNITEDNFVTRNGLELIELSQQKTGKKVTIPVLPTTKEILKDGLPYKISIQKFNDLIKQVCQEAKIDQLVEGSKIEMVDEKGNVIPKLKNGKRKTKGEKRKISGTFPKHELISSHVCRRSFATNQYGILPTPLIMQVTAHSTEKMFLGYIGKSSMDYAQQISDFYSKQAEAEDQESTKIK